jgi:hypothetical protein
LLGVWLFQHGPTSVGEIVTFMVFAQRGRVPATA